MRNDRNDRNDRNEGPGIGLAVIVRNNDVGRAISKFKKKVTNDGILHEYRERQFYTKPSAKRARAKAAGRSRWLKKLAKINSER